MINETEARAAVGSSAWFNGNPPKDGTPIVAVGRVISRGECSTTVDSFVALIRWGQCRSGHVGWLFDRIGMTVARTPDDEVVVDWWLPMPHTVQTEPQPPTAYVADGEKP